jgi:diacylglycerol kinase (ATP)
MNNVRGIGAIIAASRNSARGILYALRSERAVRQEFVLLAIAVPAAFLISKQLWVTVCLIVMILVTLAVELLNTAIEKLCDHVTPQHHPAIGQIKDMGSAAVLCMLVVTALGWSTALLDYISNLGRGFPGAN